MRSMKLIEDSQIAIIEDIRLQRYLQKTLLVVKNISTYLEKDLLFLC